MVEECDGRGEGVRTQDVGDDVEDGDEGGERGVEPSARAGAFHCGTFVLASAGTRTGEGGGVAGLGFHLRLSHPKRLHKINVSDTRNAHVSAVATTTHQKYRDRRVETLRISILKRARNENLTQKMAVQLVSTKTAVISITWVCSSISAASGMIMPFAMALFAKKACAPHCSMLVATTIHGIAKSRK